MKRYRCHKIVDGMEIKEIVDPKTDMSEHYLLRGVDGEEVKVTAEWAWQHGIKPGGYFVRYKDGYESFSPKEAFEDGYTEIEAATAEKG